MPGPLPMALRDRVVAAYQAGEGSYESIGRRFGVDKTTVWRWWDRYKREGSYESKPYISHPPRHITDEQLPLFKEVVEANNDAFLHQLVDIWHEETGQKVGIGAIKGALKRANLTRKKGRFVPSSKPQLVSVS